METPGPVIDAHALLGREHHLALEADELLRRMDAHGVERAVARPVGAELVVDNREGNDRVLRASPRIHGLVTANPWFGRRALDELARCRDLGAVGLYLHPSRQGFLPVEPVVAPVLDRAADYRWPVMVHTGTYIQSDILALAEAARLHPETSFIAGFGGFTDMWFELPTAFAEVPNLFLDTAMIWGEAVRQIVDRHGADRVLYGSGEPRNRYAVGLRSLGRLGLETSQLRAILHDNARRLFKL